MKKYRFLYALIFPTFVLTLIFCYLPMLGVVIAFQDYDIIDGIFGRGDEIRVNPLTFGEFYNAYRCKRKKVYRFSA